MLTVILSEIVAVNNDAACWMPARKLAGAAMAAASNRRLMVMPPAVIEIGGGGATLGGGGIDRLAGKGRSGRNFQQAPAGGLPTSEAAGGEKLV